ncbi:MAG: sel1 repeat family protein [Clostridia bacterium]|nr:sel1 repeat family protein [Clostridia bacterium]
MIVCEKCGYEGEYTGKACPECKSEFSFEERELAAVRERLIEAEMNENFREVLEYRHILADSGDTAAEREYAQMLERGGTVKCDLDGAMRYFFRAAQKNDPYSAYRYSRLVSRSSDRSGNFWLLYAAILGAEDAYVGAAELLDRDDECDTANYYYTLAALAGNTDAAVTMAKRYYNGIGAEKCEEYAKWYLELMTIPPIYAIPLAYRLRSVRPVEPPTQVFPNYDAYLKKLARSAKGYELYTAYYHLNEILFERGDLEAKATLGILLAEGLGCGEDLRLAVKYLISASSEGSAIAQEYLGNLYLEGRGVEADALRAIEHYKMAADGGLIDNYERIGDIYSGGKYIERDIAKAVVLYDTAAACGSESAAKKAEKYKTLRERYFKEAKAAGDDAVAFRSFAISVAMGYFPAELELAKCYEHGRGTKVDRARAFHWYKSAYEHGVRAAALELGLSYARGKGVAFNFKEAVRYLSVAERFGYRVAEAEKRRLYENKRKKMTRSLYSAGISLLYMKKFDEAARVIAGVAELGYAKAIYTLGCFLEFGIGVSVDKERAFELYECAYSLRFRDPRQTYKLQILRMIR